MKLLKHLVALSFVFYATASSAAADIVHNNIQVWSGTNGSNLIRVIPIGQPVYHETGCTDFDSYFVLTTLAKEVQARIYATLLTAKAMGSPITFRIAGCESSRSAIVDAYF